MKFDHAAMCGVTNMIPHDPPIAGLPGTPDAKFAPTPAAQPLPAADNSSAEADGPTPPTDGKTPSETPPGLQVDAQRIAGEIERKHTSLKSQNVTTAYKAAFTELAERMGAELAQLRAGIDALSRRSGFPIVENREQVPLLEERSSDCAESATNTKRKDEVIAMQAGLIARMCARVDRGEFSDNCPFCLAKHNGPGVPNPQCHLCEIEAQSDTLRWDIKDLKDQVSDRENTLRYLQQMNGELEGVVEALRADLRSRDEELKKCNDLGSNEHGGSVSQSLAATLTALQSALDAARREADEAKRVIKEMDQSPILNSSPHSTLIAVNPTTGTHSFYAKYADGSIDSTPYKITSGSPRAAAPQGGEDARRLDWLERNANFIEVGHGDISATRAAIDAAIQQEGKQP